VTRLVLLGGGHAHALVLLALRAFISKNLEVVLVSPDPAHTYSGMVPGVVAGHYAPAQAQIDLASLARQAGAELVLGCVQRLDPGARQVVLADGASLDYDIVSLNLGSAPAGAGSRAIPVKPFGRFFASWRELLDKGPAAPRIAVVGAGAGGVELAMAMKFALDRRGAGGEVVLFSERSVFPPALAARIRGALGRLAVEFREDTRVTAAAAGFDATFWTTEAAALPLVGEAGIATDARGFALVDASLRSVSHPDVFAAGDTASLEGRALPKSGVYAIRQGAVLAENLQRVVRGLPMLDYVPQARSLMLLSCGSRYAIASRGGWSAEGRWAWWWKDWLDRRWMAKFR
jgi:selenide,water dikinase